jgi:hypothetical protein
VGVFDEGAFDSGSFDVDVTAPTTPDTSSPGSGYVFVPSGFRFAAFGVGSPTVVDGLDRLIDPVTGDYVRTENGEWTETQDSRTIMLIAMSVRLGRSAFDAHHGTSIQDRVEAGSLTSPEFILAESARVGGDLADEGTLSNLIVTIRDRDGRLLRDENGKLTVNMQWRDLASGSPVQTTFTP